MSLGAGLCTDSGTGDSEAPDEEEEDVMLSRRSLVNDWDESDDDPEKSPAESPAGNANGNCVASSSLESALN